MKTSTNVPAVTQGTDAGKKIVGRKRGIISDALGLLVAVVVTAASVSDNVIGMNLLDQATAATPPQGPAFSRFVMIRPVQTTQPRRGNTASALVGDRRVVRNDPDIGPITRERRGHGSSPHRCGRRGRTRSPSAG